MLMLQKRRTVEQKFRRFASLSSEIVVEFRDFAPLSSEIVVEFRGFAPLSYGIVHGLANPENMDFRSKIGFWPPEQNSLVFD